MSHARRLVAPSLLALAVLAAALLLRGLTDPSGAGAAKVKLSGAEKAAMDITAMRSTFISSGLRVSVRLRGNIDARLGKGNLKNAALAIVVFPKTGAPKTAAMLTGPASQLRALGQGGAKGVAIGGSGNLVRFYLPDADPNDVSRVIAKTLIKAPTGKARASASAPLGLAIRCAKDLKARIAGNSSYSGNKDGKQDVKPSGTCGGDVGSVPSVSTPGAQSGDPCVDLQTDIDGIQADLAQVNDDIARATSKHRQGLAARLTDLKSELDSGLAEKQAALKALQDSGACGFNLDGSAGYDHTFDPDNAGFSSVCAEATTSPPVDGAAWEATFSDDSHHDADVTKTGTTGADGIVKTVYRITSGSKKVHIVVKVTKASQTASKTFDIQVPAPDSTKSKDCKAVNGG